MSTIVRAKSTIVRAKSNLVPVSIDDQIKQLIFKALDELTNYYLFIKDWIKQIIVTVFIFGNFVGALNSNYFADK